MFGESDGRVELAAGVSLPRSALRFRFARSDGPGGQNVNKLNTKATLTVELADLQDMMEVSSCRRLRQMAGRHLVGERIVISSSESRSQLTNRRHCVAKLRRLIERARRRPRIRKATKPSRAANERRLSQKTRRSQAKRLRSRRPQIGEW